MTHRREVLVIGIGTGDPSHLTLQAIEALNRADVVIIPDKGAEKGELAGIRRDICERHIRRPDVRLLTFEVPKRQQSEHHYDSDVAAWHAAIAQRYADLLTREVADGERAAFLVWGDPSLYDSTLRILDRVQALGTLTLHIEVIPGITSLQVLTAQHRTVLNEIGKPVAITTGRRLTEGWPAGIDTVAVMLTAGHELRTVREDVDVFWGAYLGTPDEILIAGRLSDVIDRIERTREEARRAKGWIMDTTLLKRRG